MPNPEYICLMVITFQEMNLPTAVKHIVSGQRTPDLVQGLALRYPRNNHVY